MPAVIRLDRGRGCAVERGGSLRFASWSKEFALRQIRAAQPQRGLLAIDRQTQSAGSTLTNPRCLDCHPRSAFGMCEFSGAEKGAPTEVWQIVASRYVYSALQLTTTAEKKKRELIPPLIPVFEAIASMPHRIRISL